MSLLLAVGSVHVSDGEYLAVIFVVTLVVINKTGRVSEKSVPSAEEIYRRLLGFSP